MIAAKTMIDETSPSDLRSLGDGPITQNVLSC